MTIKEFAELMVVIKASKSFKVVSVLGDDPMKIDSCKPYVYGFLEPINGGVICGQIVKRLENEEIIHYLTLDNESCLFVHHAPERIFDTTKDPH